MEIKLMPMKKSHIADILEISGLSFHTPWSKDSFLKELSNTFAHYVVAVVDNKAIGYGGMWIIIDEGHITNIAIHPNFRGQNVGTKILKEMMNVCENKNVQAMTLEVRKSNLVAQKLYSNFGFKEEGIRKHYYEDNKEDCIIMWNRDISQ